jgi:hypothetical protein
VAPGISIIGSSTASRLSISRWRLASCYRWRPTRRVSYYRAMPGRTSSKPRVSREMRLLLLTIVVSAAVLLLLARLRFADSSSGAGGSSAPFEALVSQASFEELARRVARLESSIAPNLVVLRLAPRGEPAAIRLADLRAGPPRRDVSHVPALRIDATTGVAAIPPGIGISGIVGRTEPPGTAEVISTDPVRHIARVRVPEGRSESLPRLPLSELRTPAYVVAVEGTRAGVTLRPVFLGRSDRFASPRWTRPLLPLGGAVLTPGALIFTLDGEFLGCAVLDEGILAIAGAADIFEAVSRQTTAVADLADPGVAVHALTAAVAAATGASGGVVIAEVSGDGPAAGVLEPGDVVTEMSREPVRDPESFLLNVATRLPAGAVSLSFIRDRAARTGELRQWSGVADQGAGPIPSQVRLEAVPGVGARITELGHNSPLAAAGLIADDVIIRAGSIVAPSPEQVRTALDHDAPSRLLLLVVRRQERQYVTAVTLQGNGGGGGGGR